MDLLSFSLWWKISWSDNVGKLFDDLTNSALVSLLERRPPLLGRVRSPLIAVSQVIRSRGHFGHPRPFTPE